MARRRVTRDEKVSWFERQMRERTAVLTAAAHEKHRKAIIAALTMLEYETREAQKWREGQLTVTGIKPPAIESQYAERMKIAVRNFDERVLAAYNVLRGARKWRKQIWKDPLLSFPEKLQALTQV